MSDYKQQFNMSSFSSMKVIKRNGSSENVSFDKVLSRIETLVKKHNLNRINPYVIAQETIAGICDGQTTEEIDTYTSIKCAEHIQDDPQYDVLAAAICISRLHKLTDPDFKKVTETLYNNTDATGVPNPIVSLEYYNFVMNNIDKIQSAMNYEKDFGFSFFAYRTLERSYLHRIKTSVVSNAHYKQTESDPNVKKELEQTKLMKNKYGYIVERPQCMFMRVALALNINSIDDAIETYKHISNKHFIFGSPTLYNSGSKRQQLSSCFEENTEVFTYNEGVKKIKDVKIGDRVLTHTGSIKAVKQIHKNTLNNRKMYNLKVNNTKNIVVTDNHKFMTIKGKESQWKAVEDMTIADYILLPKLESGYIVKNAMIDITHLLNIIDYQTNGDFVNINNEIVRKFINIDDNLAFLLGMFCSRGRIQDGKIIILTQTDDELLRLIEICRMYGIKEVSNNYISCIIESHIFCKVLLTLSGIPNVLYNTGTSFYYCLLQQMVTEQYHDYTIITNKNVVLLNKLYHVLRSLGIDIFFDNKSLSLSTEEYANMQHNNIKQHVSRVLAIEQLDIKPNYVYTLGVEDDHSYVVEGLVCENCYLLDMVDSIEGIAETIKDSMLISKWAGGIGIHVQDIRAAGSVIRGTNGSSDGIVPLARVLNNVGIYVNQGGRRKGAIALYTEAWHADIYDFCEMRKDSGSEHMRARDLFLALWINDLFMKRVEKDEMWSLMCPDECPGLTASYGKEFEELYLKYESEGRYKRQVKAQHLMKHIICCQIETGTPYLMSKESANMKSNQKNLGTIKSSNLCVTGDTYVLTDKGQLLIKDIVDQKVNVWNGQEWSEVDIRQTGVDQELVQVDFSNGVSLKCTPYHRFVLNSKEIKAAEDLINNDELLSFELPYDKFSKELFEKYYNNNNALVGRLELQTIGIDSYITNNKLYLTDCGKMNSALLLAGDMSWRKSDSVYVKSVTKLDKHEDVYCFTEPKRHMGMFNGILTMQCSEIVLYSDKDEIAVCNLASLCLPSFIDYVDGKPVYNYKKLFDASRVVTRNVNNVIDINYYPVDKAERSNKKHRPIGVGCQGLADVYCIFEAPFDSPEAFDLNDRIFETIYFGCLTESCELAKKYGHYESFPGSPFSQGILQFHAWGKTVNDLKMNYDWTSLINDIKKYGTRNSQLTALMPTASTSQIMGFNECFEPMTENIYTRTTLAGEYVIINKYLVEKLISMNLWTKQIRNEIKFDGGSIQKINEIPDKLKNIYRTAFEMGKMKPILDQSCRRAIFIDQSQSMNLFMEKPDSGKLYQSHMYAWKNGLKTWLYYLRTQPTKQAINFGLDPSDEQVIKIKRGLMSDVSTNVIKTTNAEDPRRTAEINIPRNPKFANCEGCSS